MRVELAVESVLRKSERTGIIDCLSHQRSHYARIMFALLSRAEVRELILLAQSFADRIDRGVRRKIETLFDISQLCVCTHVGEFRVILPEGACS